MSDQITHLLQVVISGQGINKSYVLSYKCQDNIEKQAAFIAVNGFRIRERTGALIFFPVHRVYEVRLHLNLEPEDLEHYQCVHGVIYEP